MTNQVAWTRRQWERLIPACYPSSWRRDGRAEDMIVTALTAAEADHRDGLGPYDVADLVAFGLRMRCQELGEAVPWPARAVMAWGGLLSGLFLAVSVLVVPARADPLGYSDAGHSWYPALSVAWLVLAAAVLTGRRKLIRSATALVIIVPPLLAYLGTGFGLPSISDQTSDGRVFTLDTSTSHSPILDLLVPLWLFALMTVDLRSLAAPSRRLSAVPIAATVIAAAAYAHPRNGYLFLSTPPMAAPAARDAIVLLAAALLAMLVHRARAAPAVVLLAVPWALPAIVTVQNPFGERTTLAPWQIAATALAIVLATLAIWRPQTHTHRGA